jgi:hypothetical protein
VLQAEFETLQAALDLGEGEHTWEKVDRGIVRFTAVVKGGGYKHANFVEGVGKHHAGLQLASYVSCSGSCGRITLARTCSPLVADTYNP